jgi:cobyrinic acid a,c-diamide synthase
MRSIPRLVISATRGGLGKTTFSLGIIAAWRKQGKRIAVFKKGPDFIDAGWLGTAAGMPCYNLDLFMMEQETVLRSFLEHSSSVDGAVIEGNRGLYDGVDEAGTFSTARLARLLKTPVVLIVDCTKASGTVAAMVLGCRQYDRGVDLRGVILNNVSPGRHETVIRKAIEQVAGIPVVGAVPRRKKDQFPERHMGLIPFQEHPEVGAAIAASAAVVEQYLDTEELWRIASAVPELIAPESALFRSTAECGSVDIGVIRDSAFQFYYPDNIEALERNGARIVEINALKDRMLPKIDALYIGGGFPETQAAALSSNQDFCWAIKAAADEGLPIYAECGGLIYLGRSLTVQGTTYPMSGVFAVDFVLEERPQAHGYTILEVKNGASFLGTGACIKGHEFHYSRVVDDQSLPPMAYGVSRGNGIDGTGDGLIYRNVLACYTHLHALATPQWAPAMVEKANAHRKRAEEKAGCM